VRPRRRIELELEEEGGHFRSHNSVVGYRSHSLVVVGEVSVGSHHSPAVVREELRILHTEVQEVRCNHHNRVAVYGAGVALDILEEGIVAEEAALSNRQRTVGLGSKT